jgi:hypothetical protein
MAETDKTEERLRIAKDLVSSFDLDVTAALALLNTMPDTLGESVSEAVDHAKRAVAAAPGNDHRHQAVARYMVARVLASLEQTRDTGRAD